MWGRGLISLLCMWISSAPFDEKTVLSPLNYPGTIVKKIKWYKCEGLCLESQFSSIDLHVHPYTLFWFLQLCRYILNFRSASSSTISYSWTVKVKSLTSPTSQKKLHLYKTLPHFKGESCQQEFKYSNWGFCWISLPKQNNPKLLHRNCMHSPRDFQWENAFLQSGKHLSLVLTDDAKAMAVKTASALVVIKAMAPNQFYIAKHSWKEKGKKIQFPQRMFLMQ